MPPQQKESSKVSRGEALGFIYLVARCHEAGLSPFIRSGQGSEAYGIYAILALAYMVTLTKGHWASCMGLYIILWFFALAYRRIETFNRWRKGIVTHSRYVGDPWLAGKIVKDPERARLFEPVMCLFIGAAMCIVSTTVGYFVMSGVISLGTSLAIDRFVVFKRMQHMHDAQIEGQGYRTLHASIPCRICSR